MSGALWAVFRVAEGLECMVMNLAATARAWLSLSVAAHDVLVTARQTRRMKVPILFIEFSDFK